MFSAVKQLADFTPDAVRGFLADGKFAAACAGAQVIALTDWTLYPHMTEVWKMLQREVFSELTQRPDFFIDLVDPSSRSAADILASGRHSPRFRTGRTGDARSQWQRGEHPLPPARPALRTTGGHAGRDLAAGVRPARLGSASAAWSSTGFRFAVSASAEGGFIQPGPYCANPKKSTGAGDRFNAGFCLGLAFGIGDAESLALGCAVSGFFVRNARSASQPELVDFLRNWAAGTLDGTN